ncbi:hypothetical protein GBAR_LOCUS21182 [Geodia barretti]|uniref:Uncharacterized protein n=1 Tax=Geodia barretti TaxID=519541 RepID=A0AA35WXW0_GEOBA|nr:hypothetical protein GBAR_LOCUS21182 [Geodia barretti]
MGLLPNFGLAIRLLVPRDGHNSVSVLSALLSIVLESPRSKLGFVATVNYVSRGA